MIYLSLGSNLGNREGFLTLAREFIELKAGKIIKASSIYETEEWTNLSLNPLLDVGSTYVAPNSKHPAPYYLNQVICIETQLSPDELLNILMNIEKSLGRVHSQLRTTNSELRTTNYQPRTIDIDILFYDDLFINSERLIIPHSLLHERKFVLVPLAEIAPEFIHPLLNKSVREVLKECKDKSLVMLITHKSPL